MEQRNDERGKSGITERTNEAAVLLKTHLYRTPTPQLALYWENTYYKLKIMFFYVVLETKNCHSIREMIETPVRLPS